MNKLTIEILLILNFHTIVYSQTVPSKAEIYKSWLEMTNQNERQLNSKFKFDSIIIDFIDSLKYAGIDTIGAYEEKYVGTYSFDTCECGITPWMAFVQWINNGQVFQRKITECCCFNTISIDNSVLIGYYIKNMKLIDNAQIIPNIIGATKEDNGKLSLIFSMIDHTTHYLIYCDINNHKKFVKFEKYDFENKSSVFHNDNNNSVIKSWHNMIINDIIETN